VEGRLGEKSPEERRMERLLRRTAREIYKLRKTRTNKGQLDVQSFRYFKDKFMFALQLMIKNQS
jgi:hypothetical protein